MEVEAQPVLPVKLPCSGCLVLLLHLWLPNVDCDQNYSTMAGLTTPQPLVQYLSHFLSWCTGFSFWLVATLQFNFRNYLQTNCKKPQSRNCDTILYCVWSLCVQVSYICIHLPHLRHLTSQEYSMWLGTSCCLLAIVIDIKKWSQTVKMHHFKMYLCPRGLPTAS